MTWDFYQFENGLLAKSKLFLSLCKSSRGVRNPTNMTARTLGRLRDGEFPLFDKSMNKTDIIKQKYPF